jgi:hypothetical protein
MTWEEFKDSVEKYLAEKCINGSIKVDYIKIEPNRDLNFYQA